MNRQNSPKNPGERNRDTEKSLRGKRNLSVPHGGTQIASHAASQNVSGEDATDIDRIAENTPAPPELFDPDSPFAQTPWTTERLDASTHADQMTRRSSTAGETAILVGVYSPKARLGTSPLVELAGLAEAANVHPVGEVIQRRDRPDNATCVGSGKVEEIRTLVERFDADVVIFDNDLAPGQTRNLEQTLKVKVIDRTELILDIFASRAQTHEARLAVELAQLEYAMPRLRRMWTHLERQAGGGVGLRGPGEKQLEVDRRIAQKRINGLKTQIDAIHQRKTREVASRKRSRTVCLVGYTNAGKSTILNRLTDADVYVEDRLFATLDTRTRRWFLPGWGPVLLSDTVGFIRDLPHHLVASFRATLEEAQQADLLIHVADAANPEVERQIESAAKVLVELGMEKKETLLVLNKTDAVSSPEKIGQLIDSYPLAVAISAHDGAGLERLTAAVGDLLSREFLELEITALVADGELAALLAREGEILSREYDESGGTVRFHCRLPKHHAGPLLLRENVSVRTIKP